MSSGTSNIVVNLKNDGFGTEATTSQSNLERLQFVSDMFGGDMQNVNLYGASNGSHAVISMAAVLKDNPNIDIKNVMAIDYGLAGQTNEQFIKDLASSGTNLILGTDSSREDENDALVQNTTYLHKYLQNKDFTNLGRSFILQ